MEKELNGKMLVIPEHVAIILDGNGRWAKKRLMPRNYGHSQGAKTVEPVSYTHLVDSDSYVRKNRGRTKEGKLERITAILGFLFFVVAIGLCLKVFQ